MLSKDRFWGGSLFPLLSQFPSPYPPLTLGQGQLKNTKNKAVYTTAPVAGGWAGAVMSWAGAEMIWAGA